MLVMLCARDALREDSPLCKGIGIQSVIMPKKRGIMVSVQHKTWGILLAICLMMGIAPWAMADTADDIHYTDENGVEQICASATIVTSNEAQWNEGWYVAQNDVTIDSRVTITGHVYLILQEGATLTASKGIHVGPGNSFTVYGEGNLVATGTTVDGENGTAGIGGNGGQGANVDFGAITLCTSGSITATGGRRGAGIGGGGIINNKQTLTGEIVIYSGNITATGGQFAAGIGSGPDGSNNQNTVTIKGGTINASTVGQSAGIGLGGNGSIGGIFISGGSFTNKVSVSSGNTLKITGGSFLSGISLYGYDKVLKDILDAGFGYISEKGTQITQGLTRYSLDQAFTVGPVSLYITEYLDLEAHVGDTLKIQAEKTSDLAGTIAYAWFKESDGSDTKVGAGNTYTPTEAGNYYCVVTCDNISLYSDICDVRDYGAILTKADGTEVKCDTLRDALEEVRGEREDVKITLMKDAEDEYFLDLYLFGPEAELNLNGCTISNLQEFMIGSAVVITDSVGTGKIVFSEGAWGFQIQSHGSSEGGSPLTLQGGTYENGIRINDYGDETLASILGEGYRYQDAADNIITFTDEKRYEGFLKVVPDENDAPKITEVSSGNEVEEGASYYGELIFAVADENLMSVTIDGKEGIPLTDKTRFIATDTRYRIPGDNQKHRIVATDLSGNQTSVEVTVYEMAYTVTVLTEGNGTATASAGEIVQGSTVTLTATPGAGAYFKEWVVVSGNVIIEDNRFVMPAGNVTVKAVFGQLPYLFIYGEQQTVMQGAEAEFGVEADIAKFKGVKVDGVLLTENEHYTKRSGSTIVTLTSGFVNTLSAGEHTLDVIFTDGVASTTFTIASAPVIALPQTGDGSRIGLWFVLLAFSAMGTMLLWRRSVKNQ